MDGRKAADEKHRFRKCSRSSKREFRKWHLFGFRWLHEKFTRYRAPEDEDASTRTIKEAMRKEMIAIVREGMREGIQELMRESEKIYELMRKIDPMD